VDPSKRYLPSALGETLEVESPKHHPIEEEEKAFESI